jgi:hypothetical protein
VSFACELLSYKVDSMRLSLGNKAAAVTFLNRLRTVERKGDQLCRLDADVYILVKRHGKYYEYSSRLETGWPPTREIIVSEE